MLAAWFFGHFDNNSLGINLDFQGGGGGGGVNQIHGYAQAAVVPGTRVLELQHALGM